jgi:MinD superfamily P-loop ATPase
MGGIGKTTLSTKVFQLFHNQYEKSSFLEDVKSKDINDVKKKNFYEIYVVENYTSMKMSINTLMRSNNACYQIKFWWLWMMLV